MADARRLDGAPVPRPAGGVLVLVINLLGAWLFLGGEAGSVQFARNSVGSVASFRSLPSRSSSSWAKCCSTGAGRRSDRRRRAPDPASARRLAVVAVVAGTVFRRSRARPSRLPAMLGSLMLR